MIRTLFQEKFSHKGIKNMLSFVTPSGTFSSDYHY